MSEQKRKKMFIDPAVQGALLRRLMLHWFSFVFGATWTIVILQVMTHGIQHPLSYHLEQVWKQYGILILVMICFLPAFIYDSVKLSHRFAGPIYKLRGVLKAMADGEDIEPMRFRKSDYWFTIADDVNRIAERLKQARAQNEEEQSEDEMMETIS